MLEIIPQRRPVQYHAIFFRRFLIGLKIRLLLQVLVQGSDGSALSGNLSSHTLCDFARRTVVYQQVEFRLPLDIYESWRNHQARCIDPFAGGSLTQIADGNYAVTSDSNITDNPGSAGTVHNTRIGNDEII